METVNGDRDQANADWTKTSWDLPPYRSKAFLELVPDVDAFRKLPVYAAAVAQGLIYDDEWMADFTED